MKQKRYYEPVGLIQFKVWWKGETRPQSFSKNPQHFMEGLQRVAGWKVVPDVHKRGVWWLWSREDCGTMYHRGTLYSLNADDL
jgi:hypothetical protein